MNWTIRKVRRSLNGRLIGNLKMRKNVLKTLLFLPSEMISYITNNVWFISSPEDAWAFTFRGSDIKGQHLIILSDELLKQDENSVKHTILHEIAHVMLNHRNSMGFEQTQSEIRHQELEADRFVRKYLI